MEFPVSRLKEYVLGLAKRHGVIYSKRHMMSWQKLLPIYQMMTWSWMMLSFC